MRIDDMVAPTPIRKTTTEDMVETLGSAYQIIKDFPDGYGLFVVSIGPANEVELLASTANLDDLQIAGAASVLQIIQAINLQAIEYDE
jgi:hypothetical protein